MATACTALAIIPAPESAALAVCAAGTEKVKTYLGSARSRNTVRGYNSAMRQFERRRVVNRYRQRPKPLRCTWARRRND
jgi:hypothetical protein